MSALIRSEEYMRDKMFGSEASQAPWILKKLKWNEVLHWMIHEWIQMLEV